MSLALTIIAKLSPITCVIRGAPKQDARAISGLPLFATTVSATQSATEFPIANTVNPRMAVGVSVYNNVVR